MSNISIFRSADGEIQLQVSLSNDSVWLSLKQLAALFERDRSVISRHIANVFKSGELSTKRVIANFATTAADGKIYQVDYYNLDVIISIGYRVNSKKATQFRIWATGVLKQHLLQGYTANKLRLAERQVFELQQSIELLEHTLKRNPSINDLGSQTIQLIRHYAKTWHLLLSYDKDQLKLPKIAEQPFKQVQYLEIKQAITALKSSLYIKDEASDLFGLQRDNGLQSILGNIEQTFDGHPLYKTVEERAAKLIYFIIKDHPFCDGNKRIGCLVFLIYLQINNKPMVLNDNGLVALALLIAQSKVEQKSLIIRLIVNMLMD